MIMGLESSGISITADSVKVKILQDMENGPDSNASEKETASALYSKYKKKKPIRCFSCQKIGHIASKCNKKLGIKEKKQVNSNSGAYEHITKALSDLYNVQLRSDIGIPTVHGYKLRCELTGKVDLNLLVNGEKEIVAARDLHYVKNIATNLLLVSEIVKKSNKVTVDIEGAKVIDSCGDIVATASNVRGIYKVNTVENTAETGNHSVYAAKVFLWHRRLGHLNRKSMTSLKNMATWMENYGMNNVQCEQRSSLLPFRFHPLDVVISDNRSNIELSKKDNWIHAKYCLTT
ncbi:uncharacterized protein LOC124799039 [Schistocerca piceifrons]|uniref:uncharacterized protein LOC124799039 n=1 Tax=Schistocerca piceifrons TaxID=274613 RepID=UPI001F5EC070|nr:uncharacterized protein LOC124799039 [Schistocerca piceifrons]